MINHNDFDKLFAECNVNVSDEIFEKFDRYADMLVEWNKICNLTAILDPDGILLKHFFDSVYPFTKIDSLDNMSIIDVGTGAGFPSIPLKICNDSIKLTMLDSLNKRINFLNAVADELSFEADCVHGRAEEFGQKPQYREKFDIATARAVAPLDILAEYCLPFVKVGGLFVALKGSAGKEEVENAQNAFNTLGGKLLKTLSYSLPNGDERTLVLVKKISHTPAKYPRNKGQMTKKPL